jgi:hypothetical protein
MDLKNDGDLELFLGHACRYEDHFNEACWKLITDELDKVSPDRIQKCFKYHLIKIVLGNVYRRPITYLFGKLKIPYLIEDDIKSRMLKRTKQVQVKAIDLHTIQIDKDKYEVSKMVVTRKMAVLKNFDNHRIFNGFDLTIGKETIHFDVRADDSYRLISALVYLHGGVKQFQTTESISNRDS